MSAVSVMGYEVVKHTTIVPFTCVSPCRTSHTPTVSSFSVSFYDVLTHETVRRAQGCAETQGAAAVEEMRKMYGNFFAIDLHPRLSATPWMQLQPKIVHEFNLSSFGDCALLRELVRF